MPQSRLGKHALGAGAEPGTTPPRLPRCSRSGSRNKAEPGGRDAPASHPAASTGQRPWPPRPLPPGAGPAVPGAPPRRPGERRPAPPPRRSSFAAAADSGRRRGSSATDRRFPARRRGEQPRRAGRPGASSPGPRPPPRRQPSISGRAGGDAGGPAEPQGRSERGRMQEGGSGMGERGGHPPGRFGGWRGSAIVFPAVGQRVLARELRQGWVLCAGEMGNGALCSHPIPDCASGFPTPLSLCLCSRGFLDHRSPSLQFLEAQDARCSRS